MAKNSETTAARVAPLAVSIPEAREISGLSRSTLYEAIRSGALTARKAGRRTLILRDDLRAFLAALPAFNHAA